MPLDMMCKILNKISFKENKRRYLNLKGIFSRRFAYKGPDVVQIDLTDRCNSHCLICWLHSLFVKEDKNTKELDFITLKNFISYIAKSGTKEIIFSGGGEPFFYSKIWEVLEFTQKAGLTFRINTNFTLLSREDINRLLSFNNLVSLTVSIWAGEASLYSKLHNRDSDIFFKIKNNLKFLNISKPRALYVKVFVVVNNLNYSKLAGLIDLSTETGCNAIELGVPDVIPGVTDSFLLSKEQLSFLKQDFIKIIRNLNGKNHGIKIINKNIFLRRISNSKACYGAYDSFVERIPCYAGWTFLRLRANGDFNSCLKSHRIPIGNFYKDSFPLVWNGLLQQEFREKGLSIPKDKKYFKVIGNSFDEDVGCKRVCDNILTNEHLYKIIKFLPWI